MYKKLAMLVTMIQYTELLWEMAAKRKGEKVRWRVILALEGLKALCRLVMLHLTDKRPLLTSPLPEREVDQIITPPSSTESSPPETPPNEPVSWKMPRTGLSLPSLPTNISHYLLSKVLTPDDLKPPPSLLPLLKGSAYLGELLYIVRPIIYAIALKKYAGDKKSWKPWLLGFGVEYAARELVKRVTVGSGGLEKEEMGRREWALVWWALRGAGYENFVGYVFPVGVSLQIVLTSILAHGLRLQTALSRTSPSLVSRRASSRTTNGSGTTTISLPPPYSSRRHQTNGSFPFSLIYNTPSLFTPFDLANLISFFILLSILGLHYAGEFGTEYIMGTISVSYLYLVL